MPEGAALVLVPLRLNVTKSLLDALYDGLVPKMLRKAGLLGLLPVMAFSSFTQLDACAGLVQGSGVGTSVVNTILPFNKLGKLTERSLSPLDVVDAGFKSKYHPNCCFPLVLVVDTGQVVW